MKPAGANDRWLAKALAQVATARGLSKGFDSEGFINSLTPDEAAFCLWVSVRRRFPKGCLVRICNEHEPTNCVNPDHFEERG